MGEKTKLIKCPKTGVYEPCKKTEWGWISLWNNLSDILIKDDEDGIKRIRHEEAHDLLREMG